MRQFLFVFALLGTVALAGCDAADPAATTATAVASGESDLTSASGMVPVRISFDTPVSISHALDLVDTASQPTLEQEFAVGPFGFTAFFTPEKNETLEDIAEALTLHQAEFVDVLADDILEYGGAYALEIAEAARAYTGDGTSQISAVEVVVPTLKADEIERRASSARVERFDVAAFARLNREAEPPPDNAGGRGRWEPSEGRTSISESSNYPGYRFVLSRVSWADAEGFDAFSTYEHDFFLNAYPTSEHGSGTYLTKSQNAAGIPRLRYAATNFPRPYIDTRFRDGPEEVAYTIGSARAGDIEENREYITYIVAADGADDLDTAKLSAQLGYRSPPNCYSTWCSFGIWTSRIIHWEQFRVPGSVGWTWQ